MTAADSTPTTQREITIRLYSDEPGSLLPEMMRAEAMAIVGGLPIDTVLAIAEAPPAPWYAVAGIEDVCLHCCVAMVWDEIEQKLGVGLALTDMQLLQYLTHRNYGAGVLFVNEETGDYTNGTHAYFSERPDCDHGDIELVMSDN